MMLVQYDLMDGGGALHLFQYMQPLRRARIRALGSDHLIFMGGGGQEDVFGA